MIIVNYDRQNGNFRYSVEENISDNEIELLRAIRDSKDNFTWDTLREEADLLYDQGNEAGADLVQNRMDSIHALEDLGLVKQISIHHEGKIKDMAFKTTDIGNVILNIRDKKV